MRPQVTIVPSQKQTRVLLTLGPDELMRANLPPLRAVRQERAATTLLQALALWMDAELSVALCAGELADCFRCDLTDEMGVGARSIFYVVEVVFQGDRRRGARIRGIGDFKDVRQLSLLRGGR
jgi:hypothetical protein